MTDVFFFSFWAIFCPFTPLKTLKIKIKEKNEKKVWRYHQLHMCTTNHDHMLHFSRDMAHDGCNFYFSFWATFCPFTLLKTQKIKI